MPLQNHLTQLERKHQALQKEIESAATRPGTDDLTLAQLKRRKLQLKDEMNRLRPQDRQVH